MSWVRPKQFFAVFSQCFGILERIWRIGTGSPEVVIGSRDKHICIREKDHDMRWLEPWVAVVDMDWWPDEKRADFCSAWEAQLKREVGPQHILRGLTATLVARRFDRDDALYQLSNGQVAEVHLTWSRDEQSDPRWPGASIFNSLDEWGRESMAEQHREWTIDNDERFDAR